MCCADFVQAPHTTLTVFLQNPICVPRMSLDAHDLCIEAYSCAVYKVHSHPFVASSPWRAHRWAVGALVVVADA